MRRPSPPTGLPALRAIMAATSAGSLRGKRLLALLALMGLPLVVQLIALIWGEGRGGGFANFVELVSYIYMKIIFPLALIFLGTAAFGDEWEGGTAHYVVGVPVSRGLLVVGRWLACVQRALLLALPALGLMYLICLLPHEDATAHYLPELGAVLVGVVLAVAGYTAVFVCFGLWLRRSVMTAFAYVLLFEFFISNLPLGLSILSLSFHTRNLLWRMTAQTGFQPQVQGLGDVEPTSALASLAWIVGYIVVCLCWSTRMLRRKEFTGGGEQATVGSTAG